VSERLKQTGGKPFSNGHGNRGEVGGKKGRLMTKKKLLRKGTRAVTRFLGVRKDGNRYPRGREISQQTARPQKERTKTPGVQKSCKGVISKGRKAKQKQEGLAPPIPNEHEKTSNSYQGENVGEDSGQDIEQGPRNGGYKELPHSQSKLTLTGGS